MQRANQPKAIRPRKNYPLSAKSSFDIEHPTKMHPFFIAITEKIKKALFVVIANRAEHHTEQSQTHLRFLLLRKGNGADSEFRRKGQICTTITHLVIHQYKTLPFLFQYLPIVCTYTNALTRLLLNRFF